MMHTARGCGPTVMHSVRHAHLPASYRPHGREYRALLAHMLHIIVHDGLSVLRDHITHIHDAYGLTAPTMMSLQRRPILCVSA